MSGDIIAEQAQRIAELEHSIELWRLAGQNWERQRGELEAALAEARDEIRQHDLWREEAERQIAERTKERDEFDAKLRAIEAAIAEVYPTWLDAEDYADAIRRVGQERDAERAVRETAEKEAHQHAEREAELYQERDALSAALERARQWIMMPASFDEGGNMVVSETDRLLLIEILSTDPSAILSDRLAAERRAGAVWLLNELRNHATVSDVGKMLDIYQRSIESGEVKA